MARFVSFEMGYGRDTVLNKKVLLESQSQMLWTGEDATTGYGVDVMLVRKEDTLGLGHAGSVAGFLAGEYFDPTSHLGIIFLQQRRRARV
jgi:CubicO group peptidase (beta-lactamase class C family)